MRAALLGSRLALAVAVLVALPAGAEAATLTFANPQGLGPSQAGGTAGPANPYPSSIPVSGVAGTVTDVNVTILAMVANADTDMVLRGPNGQRVMLISDACAQGTTPRGNWIFDDSAPGFVSRPGPCSPSLPTQQSFRPSNYLPQPGAPNDNSVEPDDLSVAPGGPPPPYVNALSSLAGGSPNGSWDLFVLDDNSAGFVGFEINSGWALTLEVEPEVSPPPATPSNEFTIGGLDGRKLSVDVASAGTVSIDDAGAKNRLKERQVTGGPGTVEVKVKLTKPAKRVLKDRGKVKPRAEVTFAPSGGTPATQSTKLKLRG